MKKIDFSFLKRAIGKTVAFGNKNAPTILTGGSILLGWAAVYVFWQESKKAEQEIYEREYDLEFSDERPQDLPVKEKAIIYLKHCWPAGLMGLGSTAGTIFAHKMDLSRLAEMYVLTQFLENKNSEQEKLIEKLKGEVKDKKLKEIKEGILEEEYPKDEVMDMILETEGAGTTLFIDKVTHVRFRADIMDVIDGIAQTNEMLKKRRKAAIKSKTDKFKDPFFSSDGLPYPDPNDEEKYNDVFSRVGLDYFLDAIGETKDDGNETRLDELLEFRYFGGGDLLKPKDILIYKQYEDPNTGLPVVCFIDYTEFLSPTYELIERNPV